MVRNATSVAKWRPGHALDVTDECGTHYASGESRRTDDQNRKSALWDHERRDLFRRLVRIAQG